MKSQADIGHKTAHEDHGRGHAHEHAGHDHSRSAGSSAQAPIQHDHHAHHDHAHGHAHAHGQTNERRLIGALAITALFMLVEVVGGLISHSLALLADAGHMLTDAASLLLALLAMRASRRPANAIYSFGHHRFEVLAAFVNGLALLAISVWILVESAQRLFMPAPVLGNIMLVIATLGVIANLGAFWVLRDGHDSINLRGAILHVLSDLLGSAAAMVAAVIILLSGWTPIDPLLSGLVSLLILRGGWRITRQSARILLEGAPSGLDSAEIASDLVAHIPGISSVHHVHAWSLTDQRPMLTLHAVLIETANRDALLNTIHARLRERFKIDHATVQLETEVCTHAASPDACHANAQS